METPPTEHDEVLFRQIPPGGNPVIYCAANSPPLFRSLFYPSDEDCDGLSLIRSRFRTEIWSAFRVQQPDARFRLACFSALKLEEVAIGHSLSGEVKATPDYLDNQQGIPWAHCIVSSVNRIAYDNDANIKKRIKEWAMEMAHVASEDIRGPFPRPEAHNPYRP